MGGKYPFYPISARRICLYHKIFITVIQICHNMLNSFQKTWQPKHIYDWPLTCWNYSQIIRVRSELEFIIYHYWYYTTCSYLGHAPFLDCSRTHNKTLQVLQRTTIGPCAYSRLITYTQQNTAGFTEDNNWAMCILSTVHVHTTKHRRFYRGQQLSHVPH